LTLPFGIVDIGILVRFDELVVDELLGQFLVGDLVDRTLFLLRCGIGFFLGELRVEAFTFAGLLEGGPELVRLAPAIRRVDTVSPSSLRTSSESRLSL